MTTFDEREREFEAAWQHDAALQFRVISRRNRLLGLWAGHLMGMTVDRAEDYAQALISAQVDARDPDAVHDKVHADLDAAKVDLSDHRLRKQMDALLVDAREQVMTEVQ